MLERRYVNTMGVWRLAKAVVPRLLAMPAPGKEDSSRWHQRRPTEAFGFGRLRGSETRGRGLVRGLAADLRGTGITANAVNPGSTDTAMLEESARIYGPSSVEHFAPQHLLERVLNPEENRPHLGVVGRTRQ
jgi:NAD(P)-dependent dehydrogenase (short-subunit alcohol dehydrogenase family)